MKGGRKLNNIIEFSSQSGWSWCAAICAGVCGLGGAAACAAICGVDGPIPVADAAAVSASGTGAGGVGALAAGFAC